jgi:hypothetical protein
MTFPAALVSALESPGRRLLGFFDAAFPDATRRYGSASVGAIGAYLPRVLNWGDITEQASDIRSGDIVDTTFEVTIGDPDDDIRALTESAYADELIGSVGTVRGGAAGVAEADWAPLFTGELSRVRLEDGRATLTYTHSTELLDSLVPNSGWLIGPNFPHSHSSATGKPATPLYGLHHSGPYTNQGFVRCLLVDTLGNKRHLVCARHAKAVTPVWKNGAQQTPTTHYVITYPVISGREYTLIEWTAAGAPTDADTITCDVDGLDANADGTGSVIVNPAAQFRHLLSNFGLADSKRGAWLSTHALLNAAAITPLITFFGARAYSSAMALTEQVTVRDLIATWATSHHVRVLWEDGLITPKVTDPTVIDTSAAPWVPAYTKLASAPVFTHDDWLRRSSTLSVSAILDGSTDKFLRSYRVGQVGRPVVTEESLQIPWGPRS